MSSRIPENCIPTIILLGFNDDNNNMNESSSSLLTRSVIELRWKLIESLAECGDTIMEEYYLEEVHPSPVQLRAAVRRVTLNHTGIPVLAAAAVRGKGIERVLDAIADYLPSPLD